MTPTTFATIPIPAGGPTAVPIAIAYATNVPVRVLVRNLSGVTVVLGPTSGDVAGSQGPSPSSTARLPAGTADIYVLAPRQKLYAVGIGAGGTVSVSVAEAIPTELTVGAL